MSQPDAVPHEKQHGKAAASGWIGSALEYYDFFIYAQAAALIFPSLFFDPNDPRMGIIGALGTYFVGYVARPIGAFYLGSWGDKHGRKNVLVLCMLMMGLSTFLVALLPTYQQVGFWAPAMLIALRLVQGFAVAGGDLRRQHDDPRARSVRPPRVLRQLHPAGHPGRPDPGRGDIPTVGDLPHSEAFESWGWRIPVPAQLGGGGGWLHHPAPGRRDPGLRGGSGRGRGPALADQDRLPGQPGPLVRVFCMALHEHHPGDDIDLRRDVRDEQGLRGRVLRERLPVDSRARQHRRRRGHPLCRQPRRQDRAASDDDHRCRGLPGSCRSATSGRSASTMSRCPSSSHCSCGERCTRATTRSSPPSTPSSSRPRPG